MISRKYARYLAPVAVLLFCSVTALAQQDYFSNWPKGDSPQEVGKALAEHFVTSPHQYGPTINYSEVGTWYGALTFSQLTHDDALRTELIKRFEPLQPGGAEAARIPRRRHVDDSIFGVIPLEIGIETQDPRYIAEGKAWADRQWENPLPNGLSRETRFWIDDMYMMTILQLEAYRAATELQSELPRKIYIWIRPRSRLRMTFFFLVPGIKRTAQASRSYA